MADKIYVCLYILCVILCQEIIGVFSEDLGESNFLIRKKRVINLEPGEDIPIQISQAPFVVNIRHTPTNVHIGVGAILSRHTVITAATHVGPLDREYIQLMVASAYSYRGEVHEVIAKHLNYGNHPHNETDGIALLIVSQAFIFTRNVAPIPLHTGPLLASTPATIFGWGFRPSASHGTEYRFRLRSITVPIMRHQDCVEAYRNRYAISDKDICTYHANKCCGHTDVGAPLVVDNQLAGLYLWTGITLNYNNPDVFVMIQHEVYAQWIRYNIVHNI